MTDKKTKKEIKAIIRKYNGFPIAKTSLGVFGVSSASLGTLIIATDLLATGGLGAISISGAALLYWGYESGDIILSGKKIKTYRNSAKQEILSSKTIQKTLFKMEKKLKAAFNKVAMEEDLNQPKRDFLRLATCINKDLQKLSPTFKIVSNSPYKQIENYYEFIVDNKFTTLTNAVKDIKKKLEPPPPPPPPKKKQPKGGFGL